MAIVYTTGTVNAANAAAVGQGMAEKLRDDVVAHVAWDLVEEYNAGGLVTWYVFKCLAAQSGLSADYYVVISRLVSSGRLQAFICENYNSTTHVASNFSVGQNDFQSLVPDSVGRAVTAAGTNATSYTLGTVQIPGQNWEPTNIIWTPSGTSTKWWLTVDNDGFTVAFNGASNGFMNFGAYTYLGTLANALPIMFYGGSSQPSNGYIVRNPAVAGIAGTQLGALWILSNGTGVESSPLLGFAGNLLANDKLQGLQRPVAEVGIVVTGYPSGNSNNGGDPAVMGRFIGKQKRIRAGLGNPSSFAFGDAYVLNSRLWVPYLPSNNLMWDTGVAG